MRVSSDNSLARNASLVVEKKRSRYSQKALICDVIEVILLHDKVMFIPHRKNGATLFHSGALVAETQSEDRATYLLRVQQSSSQAQILSSSRSTPERLLDSSPIPAQLEDLAAYQPPPHRIARRSRRML